MYHSRNVKEMTITGSIALIIGLFVALVVQILVMPLRRRYKRRSDRPAPDPFDLADIHAMKESGKITPAEAERLKAILLQRRGVTATDQSGPKGPRGFDVVQK